MRYESFKKRTELHEKKTEFTENCSTLKPELSVTITITLCLQSLPGTIAFRSLIMPVKIQMFGASASSEVPASSYLIQKLRKILSQTAL
jgi:hypothetical protein